jgi:anhydro-N-acetylmuramic acid kinase
MITYNIIGLMSGTSLDGLDIALVRLQRHENNTWTYELVQAETFSYQPDLIEKLSISTQLTAIVQIGQRIRQKYGGICQYIYSKTQN